MNLTNAEMAQLNEAVRREYPEQSFERLIATYRTLVEGVNGYNFTIYDYDNDVSAREILDRVLGKCPTELRDKALASLKELDDRFIAATVEAKRTGSEGAWLARLPKQPGEVLRGDIDAGNY